LAAQSPYEISMSPILIVEDDPDVRASLVEVLEDEGYLVATAGDGAEALDYLRGASSNLPCLILLDMMMPRMDGFQFRAEQSSDRVLSRIPVAVVTADEQAGKRASALGVNGFLRKPVQLTDLLALVEKLAGLP
jgi:two-component system, chemotaxis family, chemotaxis protein CheY